MKHGKPSLPSWARIRIRVSRRFGLLLSRGYAVSWIVGTHSSGLNLGRLTIFAPAGKVVAGRFKEHINLAEKPLGGLPDEDVAHFPANRCHTSYSFLNSCRPRRPGPASISANVKVLLVRQLVQRLIENTACRRRSVEMKAPCHRGVARKQSVRPGCNPTKRQSVV
jgi:hypothetical protein